MTYSIGRPNPVDNNWYSIRNDKGEAIIKISALLPNAWYLVNACKMLMTANEPSKAEEPTVQ